MVARQSSRKGFGSGCARGAEEGYGRSVFERLQGIKLLLHVREGIGAGLELELVVVQSESSRDTRQGAFGPARNDKSDMQDLNRTQLQPIPSGRNLPKLTLMRPRPSPCLHSLHLFRVCNQLYGSLVCHPRFPCFRSGYVLWDCTTKGRDGIAAVHGDACGLLPREIEEEGEAAVR